MTSTSTRWSATRRRRPGVLLAAFAAVGLAAAPADAAVDDHAPQDLQTRCTGEAPPVTVPNDLFVPAGQTCLLDGTVVQGDVAVRAGASLILQNDADVEGNLMVRTDGYVEATEATVQGTSQLRGAFGAYTDEAVLDGVDVRNSGFFFADDSELGDYRSRDSETDLQSVWVEGDVDTRGDQMSDLHDTVVTGRLSVRDAELGSVICASEVDGATEVRGSGGLVQIGGSAPQEDCGTNVFGDDLSLHANSTTDGTHVSNAIVRGSLACTGNDPAPIGVDNRIRGGATGQCADLPAPAGHQTGTFAETDRAGDTQARIKERSAQAREQAELLGTATIG